MMTRRNLDEISQRNGWTDDEKIQTLCNFIDEYGYTGDFAHFLLEIEEHSLKPIPEIEVNSDPVATLSTGEPSTLKSYRNIAVALSGREDSKAVQFFDEKIKSSPKGEDEIVVVDETQMMVLMMTLLTS